MSCLSTSEKAPLNLLVVEDHLYFREVLCDMLRMFGHTAHCVATADEAITMLTSQRFDALLTDINLPGMSGIELAHFAVKTEPDIGIVFVSGYGYLVADKTDFSFILVRKPINVDQLRHAITQVCRLTSPLHSVDSLSR